jgi:protein-S-isoprenylcysteine O-methyltransferase Ste14
MKSIGTIIVVGVVIVIMGVIFSLQSKSMVGPASSFMYDNPEWTVNGSIIIGIGIVIALVGGLLQFRTMRRKSKNVKPSN